MKDWKITKLCVVEHNIYSITCDDKGFVYMYLRDGLWKFDPSDPDILECISKSLNGEHVYGLVWVNNYLYVCDTQNNCIRQFDLASGTMNRFAGTGIEGHKDGPLFEAQFYKPRGITTDNNGDLYVTDDHHIRKIDVKNGTVETIAGCTTGWGSIMKDGLALQSKFCNPNGITANDGIIFVCDTSNRSVRKISDGMVSTIVSNNQMVQDSTSMFPFASTVYNGSLLFTDFQYHLRRVSFPSFSVSEITIPQIPYVRVLTKDLHNNLIIGGKNSVFKVEDMWKYKRFLWIGSLKEEASYCVLALLPSEIIRYITEFVFWTKRTVKEKRRRVDEEEWDIGKFQKREQ